MDLLDLIRTQINALPNGPHLTGLRSVLHHIETAYKHFARGQSADESAFTDAIYRTNQAFEGSVKEAYRVLAGQDPSKKRPYDIEQYLEQQSVFRERILGQFTNYRKEWRNPSTHDYNLNFDESEAFLAIISVSAFTKLLVDEIAEKLNFDAVQKDVAEKHSTHTIDPVSPNNLVERVIASLLLFPQYYNAKHASVPIESEAQLMGALAGFLASYLADADTSTGRVFHTETTTHYVDLMVTLGSQTVLVELKRGDSPSLIDRGLEQLSTYLRAANAKHGLLFLYSDRSTTYQSTRPGGCPPDVDIRVLRPF